MSDRNYWHPGYGNPISEDHLHESEPEFQNEVMREWFFQNYEDPAESTPHDSSEGGYIYIWGGPYDAREVLSDEFAALVPEEVIDALADELERQSPDWSGKPSAERFDDYYFSVISSNTKFHETLLKDLDDIEKLKNIAHESKISQNLFRLLCVNIVTVLEVFLSDAFINTALNNETFLRKFVSENRDFKKKKLALTDIFVRMEGLKEEVKNYLLGIVWHNLAKIKPIYKTTFGIDFPDDLTKPLFKLIAMRHDIVHRNGKTKKGNAIELSGSDISQLLDHVRRFAQFVDERLQSCAELTSGSD